MLERKTWYSFLRFVLRLQRLGWDSDALLSIDDIVECVRELGNDKDCLKLVDSKEGWSMSKTTSGVIDKMVRMIMIKELVLHTFVIQTSNTPTAEWRRTDCRIPRSAPLGRPWSSWNPSHGSNIYEGGLAKSPLRRRFTSASVTLFGRIWAAGKTPLVFFGEEWRRR